MRSAFCILLASLLSTCAIGNGGASPVERPTLSAQCPAPDWTILHRGSNGRAAAGDVTAGRESPFVEIATDAEGYRRLWTEHIDDSTPPMADFARSIVVFLLLPPRPTGGYAIRPVSYAVDDQILHLTADLVEPERGSFVTQAFTAPFAVIAIPRRDLRSVEWVTRGRRLARLDLPAR